MQPQVVLVQSEPVPSQDKGGGFRGGLATRPGKNMLATETTQHYPIIYVIMFLPMRLFS